MRWFDYGFQLPDSVRLILVDFETEQQTRRNSGDTAKLIIQAIAGIWLIFALAFHLAEVGIIGLTVIVFITAFNGIIEEHQNAIPGVLEVPPFADGTAWSLVLPHIYKCILSLLATNT